MECPSPLTAEHVAAFRLALDETGIIDPVAHTSYLINMGSLTIQVLWQKSIDAMTVEVEQLPDCSESATWLYILARIWVRVRKLVLARNRPGP